MTVAEVPTQQTSQQGSQTGTAGTQTTGATQTQAIEYKFDPIEGVPLTPEFDTDVANVAKEMGWTLDDAKKFRAYEAKQAVAAVESEKRAQAESDAKTKVETEQRDTQRKQAWEKTNRDDPEYGGPKFDETTQRVQQLLDASGERGKSLLKEMGDSAPVLLSMPAFRGFLAHLAYQMADAKVRQGGAAGDTAPKSFADVAYGNKYPAAAR